MQRSKIHPFSRCIHHLLCWKQDNFTKTYILRRISQMLSRRHRGAKQPILLGYRVYFTNCNMTSTKEMQDDAPTLNEMYILPVS